MAISVFPIAAASSATSTATTYGFATIAADTAYGAQTSFNAGLYNIDVLPTTSVVTYTFFSNSSVILTGSTTSGSALNLNLASQATSVYLSSSEASTAITINRIADNLPGTTLSGTLDTITTSGTYNQTGKLYVLAVGAGAGGRGGNAYPVSHQGGAGGGAGSVTGYLGYFNTATSVGIGAIGNGGAQSANGNAGGTTTFGNVVSAAGGPTSNSNSGSGANFNDYNPQSGSSSGNSLRNPAQAVKVGTNGGGGGGGVNGFGGSGGGGSGIGTGGSGGGSGGAGNAGTGFGAGGGGGGGGSNSAGSGGAGSPGVVYVLRGF